MKCPSCEVDFKGVKGVKAHRGARTSRCKDPTLEQRLRDGLNTDPDNVQLKRRLVTLLQVEVPKGRRIKEAYDICQRMVRNPKKVWKTSSEWQTCVLELCQDYQDQTRKCDWAFYNVKLASLTRLLEIKTEGGRRELAELAELLSRTEESVAELSVLNPPAPPSLLSHWRGELLLSYTRVLHLSSVEDRASLARCLYLAAWEEEVSQEWEEAGRARKVVAGHMAINNVKMEYIDLQQTVDTVVRPLYSQEEWIRKRVNWMKFEPRQPSLSDIGREAAGFMSLHCEDLDQLVWLLRRHTGQEAPSTSPLDLALLLPGDDLDKTSFLLACCYSQQAVTRDAHLWWRVACKAQTGETSLTAQEKITFQQGRQIIRCEGGMEVTLTMKLARVFKSRQEQSEELKSRAEQYYKFGLETLLGLERGEEVRKPALRLWRSEVGQPTEEQVGMMLTEARHYLTDGKSTEDQEEEEVEEDGQKDGQKEVTKAPVTIRCQETQTEKEREGEFEERIEVRLNNMERMFDKLMKMVERNTELMSEMAPLMQETYQEVKEIKAQNSRASNRSSKKEAAVHLISKSSSPQASKASSEREVPVLKDSNLSSQSKETDLPTFSAVIAPKTPTISSVRAPVDETETETQVETENDGAEKETVNNNEKEEEPVPKSVDGRDEENNVVGADLEKSIGRDDSMSTDEEEEEGQGRNNQSKDSGFGSDIESSPGQKKRSGREVFDGEITPVNKRKRGEWHSPGVVRQEKAREETVLYSQPVRLSVFSRWEEKVAGVLEILKEKGTNKVRLEIRDGEEVCLNQQVTQEMADQIKPMGSVLSPDRSLRWNWGDGVEREDYSIEFDNPEEGAVFRKALFNAMKKKTIFGNWIGYLF